MTYFGTRPEDESQDQEGSSPAPQPASTAPVRSADEALDCAVCHEQIAPGENYLEAAYGPVHLEPCSHQPRVT